MAIASNMALDFKNNTFKIVHITSYVNGGAGTAAYRIHEALMKQGYDSSFLSLDKAKDEMKGCYQVIAPPASFFARFVLRFKSMVPNKMKKKRREITKEFLELYNSLSCELASLPFSGIDILNNPKVQAADIIHLHWVAGMIDYPVFFNNINKPVVWTFHDMNPILGLYHYKEDEIRNISISDELNKKVLFIKKTSIQHCITPIEYVAPSPWLFNEALKSELFGHIKGHQIGYSVNTEVFKPVINSNLRDVLSIPQDHTILLFVSQYINNYRKGFDLLQKALVSVKQKITLLIIGEPAEFKVNNIEIKILGKVDDNDLLCQYYCLADALVLPSREDNLPNVMLEAMSCGIPVLSFDVGGMGSVITNNFNGLKAKDISIEALANLINEYIKNKTTFNQNEIRDFAIENFSPKRIASKYQQIYNSVSN